MSDNVHGGTGSGPDQAASVTKEAAVTGAVIAFHTELMAGALAVAADFDTGAVSLHTTP